MDIRPSCFKGQFSSDKTVELISGTHCTSFHFGYLPQSLTCISGIFTDSKSIEDLKYTSSSSNGTMAKIERRSSSGVYSSLSLFLSSLVLLLVCAQKAAPSYLNAGERENTGCWANFMFLGKCCEQHMWHWFPRKSKCKNYKMNIMNIE